VRLLVLDGFFLFLLRCYLASFLLSLLAWVSFLECRGVVVGSSGALYRFGLDRIGSMTYIRTDGRMAHSLHIYIHGRR
jgi:hypothetical protein